MFGKEPDAEKYLIKISNDESNHVRRELLYAMEEHPQKLSSSALKLLLNLSKAKKQAIKMKCLFIIALHNNRLGDDALKIFSTISLSLSNDLKKKMLKAIMEIPEVSSKYYEALES